MAFVGLKVDEGVKTLWVQAADGEGLSLSAWLRAAADARLAAGETGANPGPAVSPGEARREENEDSSNDSRVSPAANRDTETTDLSPPDDQRAKIEEARKLLATKRSFQPDPKPGQR